MTKALGFLAGVWLTIAVLILVLETLNSAGPELSLAAPRASTPEDPATVSSTLQAQGDAVQAGDESDQAEPAVPDSATAIAEPQDDLVLAPQDGMPEQASQAAAQREPMHVIPAGNGTYDAATPDPESAAAEERAHSGFETTAPDLNHSRGMQTETPANDSDRPHSGADGSYLFWSPFRSEWAARGFAGRLTASTQVPVEVVNLGPGKYRVAFRYRDETERLARIAHIESVTGLNLE